MTLDRPLNSVVRHFVEGEMKDHPIALLTAKADTAINQEDFDTVVDLYAEDAGVCKVRPGAGTQGYRIRGGLMQPSNTFERALIHGGPRPSVARPAWPAAQPGR